MSFRPSTLRGDSEIPVSGIAKARHQMTQLYNDILKGKYNKSKMIEWVSLFLGIGIGLLVTVSYAMSENMRAAVYPVVNQMWDFESQQVDHDHHHFAVPSLDHSLNFNAGAAVVALSWFCVLTPLFQILMRWMGTSSYREGYNWVRWVGDSVINPFISIVLVAFLGDTNVFGLFATFVLVHVATLGGLYLEVVNSPSTLGVRDETRVKSDDDDEPVAVTLKTTVTFWPFIFSVWISLLSVVIPLTLLITTASLTYISSWEYGAITAYLLYQVVSSVIQIAYYMHLYKPTEDSWLFRTTPKGTFSKENHEAYQGYLSGNSLVLRGIVVILLLVTGTQNNFYYFPHVIQCDSSYSVCDPKSIGANQMLINKICSDSMDSIEFTNTQGLQAISNVNGGVDSRSLTVAGNDADNYDSGDSVMASFHTTCVGNVAQVFDNCFAFFLDGTKVDSPDYAQCCDPDQQTYEKPYSRCECLRMTKTSTTVINPKVFDNVRLGTGKDAPTSETMSIAEIDSGVPGKDGLAVTFKGFTARYYPVVITPVAPAQRMLGSMNETEKTDNGYVSPERKLKYQSDLTVKIPKGNKKVRKYRM